MVRRRCFKFALSVILAVIATAPAIANAVAHATGVDVRRVPVTPEMLFEMLEKEGVHA